MKTLWQHLRYWGENYVIVPFVVILLIVGTLWVNHLTGRESAEDIGAVVGSLIVAMQMCVVITLTGLTQHFLFGYRSKDPSCSLADDLHDSCVTCFLLLLFSAAVFGWIR